ncbi:MAG: amidohydrolase [Myxococcales bacterium]|nr:amidohydrolase [Myxococcales bacterium]
MNRVRRPKQRASAPLWGLLFALSALPFAPDGAEAQETTAEAIDRAAAAVSDQVIAWRRDLHANPELGNREFRTASLVAAELEALGLEVRTEVAHTGVVGLLRGAKPGPRVALRADMDALPVTEENDLPFRSKVRTQYLDREVGVMHACGHDAHTAILLGVARVLSGMRDQLAGEVLFLFQPAEEGAPPGEEGGAKLMLREGVFSEKPTAVFGLHVVPRFVAGEIGLRSGGAMAGSDRLQITVRGRQTHAAYPWLGVDPIAVASQIVMALQRIPNRRVDARIPAIVSIGAIHGGVRHNIIPGEVELSGTIRSLDPELAKELRTKVTETAKKIAEAEGAVADVAIHIGYPVTVNDPELTRWARSVLEGVAGDGRVIEALPATGAEDFSFFAAEVPGVYYWLGVRPPDVAESDAAPNHSPHFFVDESALELGVRSLSRLAVRHLAEH